MASSTGDKEAAELTGSGTRLVVDYNILRRIGGRNFRDVGGHPARDGLTVRRGRIYRSAHLATVPEGSPVRAVKLKTLVTLQSRTEVSHLGGPEATLMGSVRWEHIPIGDEWFNDQGFVRIISDPGREHLTLVTSFLEAWRSFFQLLAEPRVFPLLFHCSAGRDRTGVGAALLLELLGVERGQIVADFLESNVVFPRALLHSSMLEPVFEAIDAQGGIDHFMTGTIGLTSAMIATIRGNLLR